MRVAAAILLLSASIFADDLEDEVHEPPVTPVVPAAAVVSINSLVPPVMVSNVPPVSVGDLLAALANPALPPEAFTALVNQLTPDQAGAVAMALLKRPDDLKALVARLKTEKITSIKVALFIADVEAWAAASEFLMPVDTKRPVVGSWLEEAKARIRQKLSIRGYTPEMLAEVRALMQRAERPAMRKGLDKLNLK